MPILIPVNSRPTYTVPKFDSTRLGTNITLSDSDKIATSTGSATNTQYAWTLPYATGRFYGEIKCLAKSGTNIYIGMGDDDPALAGDLAYVTGDSNPGWAWRGDGAGFPTAVNAIVPAAMSVNDILQFRVDVIAGTVALNVNNGTWSADAAYTAGSGATLWRVSVAFAASVTGSFELPTQPTYTVPTGFAWYGNFPDPE